MHNTADEMPLADRFHALFGIAPSVIASAPGRLEVLGNHTDYNAGLTLSCAVDRRCRAALAPLADPVITLASTLFDAPPQTFSLDHSHDTKGQWTGYVLGLVAELQALGHRVPGFTLLIDSDVPRSAGLSSSAAMEMAVLTALLRLMRISLEPIELARIGQRAESAAVGAQTGLLDQLSSLLGKRGHLLLTDFLTLKTTHHALPAGWCFVAIDSGVQHDLTAEYNERRASCEAAAIAMGVETLRQADPDLLNASRSRLADDANRCARHIVEENQRVRDAMQALIAGNMGQLGQLMFASHQSSRHNFRNSCAALDQIIDLARQDPRCVGARLSGGGFGGISIHLVQDQNAQRYREDIVEQLQIAGRAEVWSAVCAIDDGASVSFG